MPQDCSRDYRACLVISVVHEGRSKLRVGEVYVIQQAIVYLQMPEKLISSHPWAYVVAKVYLAGEVCCRLLSVYRVYLDNCPNFGHHLHHADPSSDV